MQSVRQVSLMLAGEPPADNSLPTGLISCSPVTSHNGLMNKPACNGQDKVNNAVQEVNMGSASIIYSDNALFLVWNSNTAEARFSPIKRIQRSTEIIKCSKLLSPFLSFPFGAL